MKKIILVLGGGILQVPLIQLAKERGCEVFLADYYANPPGKKYCDDARQISTMSLQDNYDYVLEKNIDHILTIGTDQPVYTAAYVSAKLNLPYPISEEQGRMVTNKLYMKSKMVENEIPTPSFRVFSKFEEVSLEGLTFPLVMKPVDSQGQRGIFVLDGGESENRLANLFTLSLQFSPFGAVIFEELYPGAEITVNTWVKEGQAFNLLLTDRLHYDDSVVLGLCKQQRFPCQAAAGREDEVGLITQKLVDAFAIKDGPLYIQMISGLEGFKIVEFGYRLGGGFESETIPRITGVDILDLYFSLVVEGINKFRPEDLRRKCALGSIFFLFANSGQAIKLDLPREFFDNSGKIYLKENTAIGTIENATSRVGCFALYADNPQEYNNMLSQIDSGMAIYDEGHQDLLIHNLWE